MAEFSSSGEFGQASKSSEIVGGKPVFSFPALPNEAIAAEFRMDVENDTVCNENQVSEVYKNDLGSIDNVVDKPVQASNAVTGGISLEEGDVSVNVEYTLENEGDVYVNVQSEQPGVGISSEAMDVSLNFEHELENQGVGICESVLGEQPRESISLEGVDASLNTEPALECQGEDVYVNVQSEQLLDGVPFAASDVILKYEHTIENQGKGANESLQREQLGDGVSLEGVEVSFNCEHVLANQDEGAYGSVPIEQPEQVISLEGMDISLVFEHASENEGQGAHVSVQGEDLGLEGKADLEAGADNVKAEQIAETKDDAIHSSHMEGAQISLDELVEKLHSDVTKNCGKIEVNERNASDILAGSSLLSIPPPAGTDEKVRVVVLASPADHEISRRGRKSMKDEAISTKKKLQQSSAESTRGLRSRSKENSKDPVESTRGLRSRSKEDSKDPVESTRGLRSRSKENSKDPEPSVDMESAKGNTSGRGRRKSKENDGKSHDVYHRMKRHLKYLLHRIHKEQNLLDAYASEGWRGQSLEKIRPEKELQRAKTDINRFKLKIRDLFQQLNSMSTEGKFPESLYDSEGLIDSEDIFCAKCGSKDLPIGNDIILCDGICERGFHQYCLDPPLRTEEIPPGDEGWLCPACDCKHDCVELVNDSQGTKLGIEDSWEKVFPEAIAAATAGKELDDIMGLPSDDSEDNEYNPEGTDDDANVEGNESNSDDSDSAESDSSDFSSASEDLGAIRQTEQNLGLPSDDSEDDDYDPDAKNVDDEEIGNESSSSDFTSASEDLGAAIVNDDISDKDEPPLTLDQEQDLGESAPLTSKRCVEKLDYKKLYDETYGNAASDSSEDEDWVDMIPTRKRKSSAEKVVPVPNLGASVSADGACGSGTSRRRGRSKVNSQGANGSSTQLQESSQKASSGGSRGKRTPYNRLGEAVTQRLYESFKENQYPDRQAKEKLADELGLTAHRVDKWFGNARWSLHHHPSRVEAIMSRVVSQSNTPQIVACNGGENALANDAAGGSADVTKLDETSEKPQKLRKNKKNDQSMMETANTENSKEGIQNDPLQTPEAPKGRAQRKRRKPDP